jgi:serine/threonine-protein kinase
MAVSDDVHHPSAAAGPDFPGAPAHYALRARLGEGGHGEVYEAWDSKLQRSVALKRIKHDGAAAGADLIREARMAASLRHPAFVKVYAIEEAHGNQFIAMELVPGRTLKQVLADGKPDLDAAIGWVRQVAEAMRDAHASGLVHGDLKPSNLMIEPDGTVRILDFGLASRQDMLETTTLTNAEPQGTIAYMAPERLLGAPPEAVGDVYALGVILYEAAVGNRPFSTLNGLALAAAHVQASSDSWHYPGTLGTATIALIRAMTARQVAHRVQDMATVLARIAQLDAGDLAAPPGGRVAPARPRPSRPRTRRGLWTGAGVVLATVLAGGAWLGGVPEPETLKRVLTPYSEAAEMEQGLAALKLYDRPGELQRAEAHFNRILKSAPDNAAAVAGLSLVQNLRYTSENKDEIWLQKSDAGAQLALKMNDQVALSHIAMGAVLDRQGHYEKALDEYARALKLDPNNYFAWYGKVESLRNARRYPQALTAITEAMTRFPTEAVFVGELGVLKFEQGQYAAAEQAFRRSIALQPDAVTPYANLNATLLAQNRTEEALRVLQQGLQVRPSASLYTNLGNALFMRGDYVGAASAFENAVSPVRGGAGYYIYWANLADTLLWLPGREKQAQQAYDKARQLLAPKLARSPNDPLVLSRMGLYSARAGDAQQALALTRRALQLAPEDASIQFRAGMSYELMDDRKDALAAINKALRLGYPVSMIEAEPSLLALRRDANYDSR